MENIKRPALKKQIQNEVRKEVSKKEDTFREYIENFILRGDGRKLQSDIKNYNFDNLDTSSPEKLRRDLDLKVSKALNNLYNIPNNILEKIVHYIEKDLHTSLDTFAKGAMQIEKLFSLLEANHNNSDVVKFGKVFGISVVGVTLIASLAIAFVMFTIFPIKIGALIGTVYISSIVGREINKVFSKFFNNLKRFAKNI